jgi:hypothetical protein
MGSPSFRTIIDHARQSSSGATSLVWNAVAGEFRLRKNKSNGTFHPVTELVCIETHARRKPEEMPSGERIRNHGCKCSFH